MLDEIKYLFQKKLKKVLPNDYKPHFYFEEAIKYIGSSEPDESDISDHLTSLFSEAMQCRPKLIVELGTRGGESTQVLLAVARIMKSRILSVDIDDCSKIALKNEFKNIWNFIQSDDIVFGKEKFRNWCETQSIPAAIDVLFIDTSHEYEHTVNELEVWLPFLNSNGAAMFHDTNLTNRYRRLDNSISRGWDNQRGVIRAIEEYFKTQYDETKNFVDYRNGFLVRHYPFCNGFTVLRKIENS